MVIEPTLSGINVLLRLLTKDDLVVWLQDRIKAEQLFGYNIDTETIEGRLLFAFKTKIENMEKDPGKEIWYSYFAVIYKNTIVGTIGPKGIPDNMNRIEIGYGLSQSYWNRGIATEAVKLFCDWYFYNTEIARIIAETDISNIGSQKVLLKNKFVNVKEEKDKQQWELLR